MREFAVSHPSHVGRLARKKGSVLPAALTAAVRGLLVVAALLVVPGAASAQVKVLISGGFSPAYRELLPQFEKSTGITVTTATGGSVGAGPNTIGGQLRRGVQADVVILAREGLGQLITEGRVLSGSDVDLARSAIGVIVRAGAPKPDISTVDALKQTLLRAKSVAISTSTSGVYLTTKLFPQLGIAAEMAPKTQTSGSAAVGRGDAELGIQQVSEVLAVPNADFVGTIPASVQYFTTYAAAIVSGSKEVEAARRLVAFLSAEAATGAISRSGMEPSRKR